MVDMVVHRHELKATIARLCRTLTNAPKKKLPEDVIRFELQSIG
jgi:acetyl-CoA carboxylase carboxyl transferase subunit beta